MPDRNPTLSLEHNFMFDLGTQTYSKLGMANNRRYLLK
jgi:hypothetical protein